jgi:hypothetical protein
LLKFDQYKALCVSGAETAPELIFAPIEEVGKKRENLGFVMAPLRADAGAAASAAAAVAR